MRIDHACHEYKVSKNTKLFHVAQVTLHSTTTVYFLLAIFRRIQAAAFADVLKSTVV